MKTVGLVTYKQSPKLTPDDQLLVEPIKKQGFNVKAVAWDDKNVDWSKFDIIVPRSCWNYHLRYEQFMEWLNAIEKLNVPVWNPVPVIRWNSDKKYLRELEYKGIPIIPTVFIEKGEKYNIADIAHHKKWKNLVIKPAIGASSYHLTRIHQNEYIEKQKIFENLIKQSGVLVQPDISSLPEYEEYSFVFIGNIFSHAVKKAPKKIVAQAEMVIKKINSSLLYARVDGIVQNDTFLLMELELIEPELYFNLYPIAPMRFVEALQSYCHFI
jgi:glutathione synthase/RimK-type ligase-like ATP-grasp enzyme